MIIGEKTVVLKVVRVGRDLADEGDEVGEGVVAVLVVPARAVRAAVGRGVVGGGRTQGCVVRET